MNNRVQNRPQENVKEMQVRFWMVLIIFRLQSDDEHSMQLQNLYSDKYTFFLQIKYLDGTYDDSNTDEQNVFLDTLK